MGLTNAQVIPIRPSLERWVTKRELAEHLGCSVSWVEKRVPEGMPSRMIAGRRKFRISAVERYLEER